MVDHIVIMSLDAASLQRMHELRPTWTIGRLTAVPITDLTRENVDFLAVSRRMATPEFIRRAHARGKDVYVWTINDAPTMFEMISRGVDNLITDNPALARDVVEQRENMGPIDRLFVEIAEKFGTAAAACLSRRGAVDRLPSRVANACNRREIACRKTIVELPRLAAITGVSYVSFQADSQQFRTPQFSERQAESLTHAE